MTETNKRFSFGKNWKDYIAGLTDHKIEKAKASLQERLECKDLSGMKFLDIGSGSGLFSLAAYLLGATVTSFDYDQDSFESTQMLKEKFAKDDKEWSVAQGDVLSEEYMASLDAEYDIVYSWGVLHHTGQMWDAINHAAGKVKKDGKFFIAIYNDQGLISTIWKFIKKSYVAAPQWGKKVLAWLIMLSLEGKHALGKLLRLKSPMPNWKKREEEQLRGMSVWYDYVDWVGGYPYEVASPSDIFSFCKERGFALDQMLTVNGHGCNEFVFSLQKKK